MRGQKGTPSVHAFRYVNSETDVRTKANLDRMWLVSAVWQEVLSMKATSKKKANYISCARIYSGEYAEQFRQM